MLTKKITCLISRCDFNYFHRFLQQLAMSFALKIYRYIYFKEHNPLNNHLSFNLFRFVKDSLIVQSFIEKNQVAIFQEKNYEPPWTHAGKFALYHVSRSLLSWPRDGARRISSSELQPWSEMSDLYNYVDHLDFDFWFMHTFTICEHHSSTILFSESLLI